MTKFYLFLSLLFISIAAHAQKMHQYNLNQMYKAGELVTGSPQNLSLLTDAGKQGVALKNGVVWLKGFNFSTGTIEVDVKGKDVYQQSFLGIAFHGVDTITYDAVYLRPFNFHATDSLRKNHAVQYVSYPDYPWEKLRAEHPLMYEKAVPPSLSANEWVHVKIVVQDEWISVYLNNVSTPSLKIKKLNDRTGGLIGLWAVGNEAAEFANLVITTGN